MLQMTAASGEGMTFVESSSPPIPVSSTTTAALSRAKYASATAVMSSNSVGLSSMASACIRTVSVISPSASSEIGSPFSRIRSWKLSSGGEVNRPVL